MYCLSTFCCVCFTKTKRMQNLQNLDTDGISLLEKIKFCTFENEWIENPPLYICAICQNNLNVSYEFKKKCIETNKLLRGYIFQLQHGPVPVAKHTNADLNVSLIDMRPSTPIFEFIKNDESENETEYSTPILDFEKYEEILIKQEPKENSSNEEASTDCKEIINLTETIDYSEQYPGFPRQAISNSVKYLSKVVISLNAEIVRFVKFSEYVRETRRVKTCPICLKKFSRPNSIYTHMLIHKNKKPFSCTVCKKSFRQKQNMITHMSIHTGVTYYKCTQCPKSFYHYSHLTAHMPIHTGEKPHQCTKCEKRFGTKSHRTAHMKQHNEYIFRCPFCKKKFKQKFSLIMHKRVHTGEKPYKCSVCDKRFCRRQVMVNHQLTHSGEGEKPYKCTQCPKKYSLKSYLKNHQMTHSTERTFKCKQCNKKYKHAANLYKHIKNCHKK